MELPYPDGTYQYELHILDYIKKIPSGENFYDLGACLGIFSLHAALQGLRCFAFEIDLDNYVGLKANIAAKKLDNITSVCGGVSDGKNKTAILLVSPLSSGRIGAHSKILKMEESTALITDRSSYQQIVVNVDSLDNYVEKMNLPPPLHAKVDIDGSELAFLRGSPKSLTSLRSMIIEIFEGNPIYLQVLEIIDSYGFKLLHKHPITQPGCVGYYNYEYWKL